MSTPIPALIDIGGGVKVPTDVVQRSYKPHFLLVAEAETPDRQKRVDPVRPGVSVGNVKVSAGTIGCVVFDKNDGSSCLLSNWHVLNGRKGELGDDVVQPGKANDSRTALNRLGTLKRSHLGLAGDCAVSSITDREFDTSVLDLGVTPTQLGEPQIECFEIGPDPNKPADDGEISAPGDSGAAWLFKARGGRPSEVLAGLHFGGESDVDPEERALACFPRAVFEELKITLQPPAPESLEAVTGYDPGFLAVAVATPRLSPSLKADTVRLDGTEVIPYTHFSLALSGTRRFAFWVAWNIDGGAIKKIDRSGIEFKKDPRLPADAQVGNEMYKGNRLDRGHIARRADLIWGPLPEADRANTDSFFYTNITPQMDDFNQSAKAGIWGELENALFEEVEVEGLRISVFGGPVFHDDDRLFRGARLPREFWKVLVYSEKGTLKAKAFLLTQNLVLAEILELDEFRVFQVKVGEVQKRTGLKFPAALVQADTLVVPEAVEDRAPLEGLADINWH
ncbi:DNA/RNA non-specific endonuclease [Streptomyces goshikiensis]|uniref:DNA/RNA non-specific endonuclease n=1 Tax=Streptomyces goshikiensis TaxID=1942 RepID=UPI0036B1A5F9